MKIAAVAELDIVLLIIIVMETIRITTIGNGNTFMTDNLLPKKSARPDDVNANDNASPPPRINNTPRGTSAHQSILEIFQFWSWVLQIMIFLLVLQ